MLHHSETKPSALGIEEEKRLKKLQMSLKQRLLYHQSEKTPQFSCRSRKILSHIKVGCGATQVEGCCSTGQMMICDFKITSFSGCLANNMRQNKQTNNGSLTLHQHVWELVQQQEINWNIFFFIRTISVFSCFTLQKPKPAIDDF